MMNNLSKILWGVPIFALLWVYIYSPPFIQLPFGPGKLVAVLAIMYLMVRPKVFITLWGIWELKIMLLCFSLGTMYCFVIDAHNNWQILRGNAMLLYVLEVIPCSLFFSILLTEKMCNDKATILRFIVAVAAVQGVASLVLFYYPNWNYMINGEMLRHGQATEALSMFRYDYVDYRGYGISGNYFYSMPIFQSIGVLCAIALTLRKSFIYIFIVLAILPAIVLNARIGLITSAIAVIGMLLFVLFKERSYRGMRYYFFLLAMCCIMYFVIDSESNQSDSRFNKNISWISSMSEDDAWRSVSEFWIFPDSILFGDGRDIFLDVDSMGRHSDNGFVQIMFYGGLALCLCLYGGFVALVVGAYRVAGEAIDKALIIILFVIVVVGNIKGDLLGTSNEMVRGIYLILICYLVNFRLSQKSKIINIQSSGKLDEREETCTVLY